MNDASLLAFFQWCEGTAIGQLIRQSTWLFPVIESVHLLGLALLGGAVLVVDLRLLKLTLTGSRIDEVAGGARRWLVAGVGTMVATGVPLFLSEAVKCYYNPSFWVKMATLPVALLFTFLWRERVTKRAGIDVGLVGRLTALVSLGLWTAVASAGRWIGFSS